MREDFNGGLLFVVSSLNGDIDNATRMLYEIEKHPLAANDKVVFTGNYFGESSNPAEMIQFLKASQKRLPKILVFLRGQIEERILKARPAFFKHGIGKVFINSYWARIHGQYSVETSDYLRVVKLVEDREWLNKMPYSFETDKYFCVHAGIDPYKKLSEQCAPAMLFSQSRMLASNKVFEKVIVHGQSPEISGKIKCLKNRIDVGAGSKGGEQVACAVLNGESLQDTIFVWNK
jgi:serine/threonine protein phosphatase 1